MFRYDPTDKRPSTEPDARHQLDPENIERIASAVKAGLTLTNACLRCGFSKQAGTYWKQQAAEGEKREPKDRTVGMTLAMQLLAAVDQAKAEHEHNLLLAIEAHTPKQWQAAAWMLERKYGYTKPETTVNHKFDEGASDGLKKALSLDVAPLVSPKEQA